MTTPSKWRQKCQQCRPKLRPVICVNGYSCQVNKSQVSQKEGYSRETRTRTYTNLPKHVHGVITTISPGIYTQFVSPAFPHNSRSNADAVGVFRRRINEISRASSAVEEFYIRSTSRRMLEARSKIGAFPPFPTDCLAHACIRRWIITGPRECVQQVDKFNCG